MSQWLQQPLDPITDSGLLATDQQVSNREAQTTLAHFMGDRAEALAAWPPSTGAPTADPMAPAAQGQLGGGVTVVHHPVATAATSRNRESGVWVVCLPFLAASQDAAQEVAARVAIGVEAMMDSFRAEDARYGRVSAHTELVFGTFPGARAGGDLRG